MFVEHRQFKPSLNLHILKEYLMAKTKDSNGTGTAPARKRVSKTAEPTVETKSNVFPINLDEEIRKRAFELYEQRGSVAGYENEDWLTAEREVLARYRQQSA
ncbi:MAG TPA: DUF2934 domain-containing protein [Terriglobales bacterium]|nr:DUF2934 domain-containing protein [Terriglobales bacterium]